MTLGIAVFSVPTKIVNIERHPSAGVMALSVCACRGNKRQRGQLFPNALSVLTRDNSVLTRDNNEDSHRVRQEPWRIP